MSEYQSVNRSAYQLVNQSVYQSAFQSAYQSAYQSSVYQSSANQLEIRSVCLLVHPLVE
jgi:hypothetical protein